MNTTSLGQAIIALTHNPELRQTVLPKLMPKDRERLIDLLEVADLLHEAASLPLAPPRKKPLL